MRRHLLSGIIIIEVSGKSFDVQKTKYIFCDDLVLCNAQSNVEKLKKYF